MTVLLFPTLAARGWPLKRTPIWKTLKQESISGQETRQALWTYPRWRYELTYDALRSNAALQEWQAIVGLYNQVGGAAGTFAFNDPCDNAATMQQFGVGDGAETGFQLVRALGGFVEPVFLPVTVQAFRSDWQGVTGLSAAGRTNLIPYGMPHAGGRSVVGALASASSAAPDGGATCSRFTEAGPLMVSHGFTTSAGIAVAAGQSYTQTIWAKPAPTGSARYLAAFFDTGWGGAPVGVVFNVAAGTMVVSGAGVTASIVAGTGGWYRCVATATVAAGITTLKPAWRVSASPTDIYAGQYGDGTSGLLLAYEQFETGSAGTSYIPTAGAALTVTDFSLGSAGVVVFTAPPAAGTAVLWSGTFHWLCRFEADEMEFQQDYAALWALKSCVFSTVKL